MGQHSLPWQNRDGQEMGNVRSERRLEALQIEDALAALALAHITCTRREGVEGIQEAGTPLSRVLRRMRDRDLGQCGGYTGRSST